MMAYYVFLFIKIYKINVSGVDIDFLGPWPNSGAPFEFFDFFETVAFDEN